MREKRYIPTAPTLLSAEGGRVFLWVCISFLLITFSLPIFAQKMSREEYIAKYKEMAVRQMVESGIPASITMAQACLESANGNSMLAVEANNHFGIKCHGWQGASVRKDDDAAQECFRKYDSPEHSFRDHSDFLRYRDRYAFLFELDRTDYRSWAYGLKTAGYATAPDYAQRLIKIIEDNGLDKLDKLDDTLSAAIPESPMKAEISVKVKPRKGSPLYNISLSRQIYSVNGVSYILAESYDTYKTLADEFDLFYREILSFNDLQKEHPLTEGELVYIERKKKTAADPIQMHVVEEGETLYDLSQRFAIRLSSLCKYNNLQPGSMINPGEIVYLHQSKEKK